LLAEPSTPAYRTVWKRGGGTDAHRRQRERIEIDGDGAAEKAFLQLVRARPSGAQWRVPGRPPDGGRTVASAL